MLQATLALNRIENVTAKRLAVSATDGVAEINVFDDPFSSWSSLGSPVMRSPDGREVRPQRQVAVVTQTLERFCREQSIGYVHGLKIDVEGFEQAVLTGALPLLKDHRIGMICFEVSELPLAGTGFSTDMIRELLKAGGYDIYSFDLCEERFRRVEGDYSCFHGDFYAFHGRPESSQEI
jgi:FkbM family methyltransferase